MPDPPPGITEHDPERIDRELDELLQELRVLLPGTTVLFGFLLSLAFSTKFQEVTGAEEALFVVAFLATAACVVLLVAPGVRHRTRFRERDKDALLRSANRIVIAAAASLAIAITAVTTLVTEHLYGWHVGIPVGVVVGAAAVWLWFGWSASRRVRYPSPPGSPPTRPEPTGSRGERATPARDR